MSPPDDHTPYTVDPKQQRRATLTAIGIVAAIALVVGLTFLMRFLNS